MPLAPQHRTPAGAFLTGREVFNMAWIESHQTLLRHPKVIRLAALLKIHKAQAIGHLHILWWWSLDYAPDGDLSAFTSQEISLAAEWSGNRDGFKKALMECGWIDNDSNLHDWHDYAGKLVEHREKERQRKKTERDRKNVRSTSAGHPKDVRETSCATVQNSTVPNSTVPRTDAGRGQAAVPEPSKKQAATPPLIVDEWEGLPLELNTDAFKAAWGDYLRYRAEKRLAKLKPLSIHAQWAEMKLWGDSGAIQAMRETIRQGWQGIFPPKSPPQTAATRKEATASKEFRLRPEETPKAWRPGNK